MRLLERNRQDVWFANPTGSTWVTDGNGLKTGEKEITYGTHQHARMSVAISAGAVSLGSQGSADLEQYGIVHVYSHRAITDDMNCQMGEDSIVWYGVPHEETVTEQKEVNGQMQTVKTVRPLPHNFKVVSKAISLNQIVYYLREVNVS